MTNVVTFMLQTELQTSSKIPGGFCWSNTLAFGPKIWTSVYMTLDFKYFAIICSLCVFVPETSIKIRMNQNKWEDNCFG